VTTITRSAVGLAALAGRARQVMRITRLASGIATVVLAVSACGTEAGRTTPSAGPTSPTAGSTSIPPTAHLPPTTAFAPPTTAPPIATTVAPLPPTTTAASSTTTPASGQAVVVTRGNSARPVIALTFDAGSDCGNTGAILNTLATNDITATFALTGTWVERCPADAADVGGGGHLVMNHSYSHPSFTGFSTGTAHLTTEEVIDQVKRAETAILNATGHAPLPWFRPPYGDQDAAVNAALARAGYRYDVLWTVDSLGWKSVKPEQVVTNVLSKTGNGAIILMHVGAASTDHLALQAVIDAVRARGLSFGTVDDVL
jgi:peptidoglycan/xylan/chitin deacetylase (PgdA/CDA1 family)